MVNFEYDGDLNIMVNGKNVKVSKVISAEVSLNKKCEVIIVTRDGSTLSGIMENGSYKELEKDLLKYDEKYPTVGISEDSRYVFKSKDSDENIVFITSPNSDISLSLSDDFDKNIIRQDVFRDDHNEINKSGAFTVTDGLYINPNEIGNVEVTETWLLNLLRILQSNDKYKTVEKHPEIENFEVTTYYISTDIIPIFMLPLITSYYNRESVEIDLNLLQLNFLVPVYDGCEVITYVKLKKIMWSN